MPPERSFSLEKPVNKEEGYKHQILEVLNDVERRVRVINPDEQMHIELHEKKKMDSRHERREFEEVRKDICETFGVPMDEEHIYLLNEHRSGETVVQQRALRCFYVIVDSSTNEGFYGEGRTMHHALFEKLVQLMKKKYPEISSETVIEKIGENPPGYMVFKGFLSTKDFKEISDSSRRVLETPLHDARGEKVETAETWFISGHNLDEMFPPSSSSDPQKA